MRTTLHAPVYGLHRGIEALVIERLREERAVQYEQRDIAYCCANAIVVCDGRTWYGAHHLLPRTWKLRYRFLYKMAHVSATFA